MQNLPSARGATRFHHPYGKSGHHRDRLCRAYRRALRRSGETFAAGADRTMPGGLLTTTSIVENFPGFPEGMDGYELMTRMQKQAERFGARVKFGTVEAVDLSKRPFTLTVDG